MKVVLVIFGIMAVSACIYAKDEKEEEKTATTSHNVDELFAAALAKLSPEHRKIVEDTLRSAEKVDDKEKKEVSKTDEKRVRRLARLISK